MPIVGRSTPSSPAGGEQCAFARQLGGGPAPWHVVPRASALGEEAHVTEPARAPDGAAAVAPRRVEPQDPNTFSVLPVAVPRGASRHARGYARRSGCVG